MPPSRTVTVAVHDVEPATFQRCALIREWLADHGIERVTLLVIPAPDLHPFHDRSPDLADWLGERSRAGDAIAQHGFEHASPGREFAGLDETETRRAVAAGRRVLKLAGVEPRGFVAPDYAYTPALRATLAGNFDWWAGLLRVNRRPGSQAIHSPAVGLGTSSRLTRALSPALLRAGAMMGPRNLRVDLHPADLAFPRHMLALEWVLRHNRARTAITYDELTCA